MMNVAINEEPLRPRTRLGLWLSVMRLWVLPASVIPVVTGGALACYDGVFRLSLFLFSLLVGSALHVATNLLNSHCDYESGVDRVDEYATAVHLVPGWV